MNPTKFISAVAAASLALGSVAFAQGNDPYTERGVAHPESRPETNQDRGQPQQRAAQQRAPQDRERAPQPTRHEARGAGPSHNFRRGDRLPSEYRDHRYVVNDWRARHLRQPPRGYQWVQTGDDFVLAAIATGVIASVLLNAH